MAVTPVTCLIQINDFEYTNDGSGFRCHVRYVAVALDASGYVIPFENDADGNPITMVYTGDIIPTPAETGASLQTRITTDTRAAWNMPLLPVNFIFDRKGAL